MIPLVRAFTTYFYLANVAEQVHRIDQLSIDELGLAATVDRVLEAGVEPEVLAEVVRRLEMRPVLTAHPTEAARRSILTKTANLAELIGNDPPPVMPTVLVDRRTAELIDQIWQTDELRLSQTGGGGPLCSLLPGADRRRGDAHSQRARGARDSPTRGRRRRSLSDSGRGSEETGMGNPGVTPRQPWRRSCSSTIAAYAISSG